MFKRPSPATSARRAADGAARAPGRDDQRGGARVTIALPLGVGDFASGAVDSSAVTTCSSCCSSTTRERRPAAVRGARACRARSAPDDFSPNVLQRTIRGQAGVQKFFHDQGRAFCLYVVLGSFANRRKLVPLGEPGARPRMTIAPLAGDRPVDHHHDRRLRRPHLRRPRRRRPPRPPTADHRRPRARPRRPPTGPPTTSAVSVLAGPFAIAAALLAVGGALKAVRPRDTAQALTAVGAAVPARPPGPRRSCGSAARPRSWWAWAHCSSADRCSRRWSRCRYLAFAGVRRGRPAQRRADQLVRLLRQGRHAAERRARRDRPALAVAVAAAAAVVGDVALPDVLRDQPLAGVPFLMLVVDRAAPSCSLRSPRSPRPWRPSGRSRRERRTGGPRARASRSRTGW